MRNHSDKKQLNSGMVILATGESTDSDLLASLLSCPSRIAAADLLLQHFPSIGHALVAEASQLYALGLTAQDIAVFRVVHEVACRMAKAQVRGRPVVTSWETLIAYLNTAMAHEQIEQFRVLYPDRKNHLIADEVQQRGTVDHTPVYPREVMKRALILNASALIVVHNHPSGDPKPSRDDIEMTCELKSASKALGIELHDHIVVGHGKHASFRALGLM